MKLSLDIVVGCIVRLRIRCDAGYVVYSHPFLVIAAALKEVST
jgi:hypothetical protein